jgi:hypothetical protein
MSVNGIGWILLGSHMPLIYIQYHQLTMSGPIDHDVEPILPLYQKKQRGRPRKVRRRGEDENEPIEMTKVTCKGYGVRCGNCGQMGHNARSC